jgi:hypothetical protein
MGIPTLSDIEVTTNIPPSFKTLQEVVDRCNWYFCDEAILDMAQTLADEHIGNPSKVLWDAQLQPHFAPEVCIQAIRCLSFSNPHQKPEPELMEELKSTSPASDAAEAAEIGDRLVDELNEFLQRGRWHGVESTPFQRECVKGARNMLRIFVSSVSPEAAATDAPGQ